MRYLAVFRVERTGDKTVRQEEVIIEGDYNPNSPDDVELIEDNTPLADEDDIIYTELIGLHQLND